MQPTSPLYFLDMPFAENGDKTIIPAEEATAEGRATQSEGFPAITQQPIAKGGIAPNRWDFNGMFFLLSQFAHWEQSGGQATWNSELGYTPPSIVYYNKVYYVCVTESGPETDAGAVVPSEDAGTYWVTLWNYLSDGQDFVKAGDTVTLTGDTTGSGTFDSDGNVSVETTTTNATTATKLGSDTVGSGVRPIYLSSGSPVASSSTVGDSSTPVYLNEGTLTKCSISEASTYKKATNGYIKFTTSGIMIQWGTYTISAGNRTASFSFPTSFPTACVGISVVRNGDTTSSSTGTQSYATSRTRTGFKIRTSSYSSEDAQTFNWIAIGY